MILRASAEVFQPAYAALDHVRRCLVPFLNEAFAASSLGDLDIVLRFVPIVMPEQMRARYPERSKLRKKDRVYDCAPALDFDVFVEGTFDDQVREYLSGMTLSAPHLADLGASPTQIDEFSEILASAPQHIIALYPSRTVH